MIDLYKLVREEIESGCDNKIFWSSLITPTEEIHEMYTHKHTVTIHAKYLKQGRIDVLCRALHILIDNVVKDIDEKYGYYKQDLQAICLFLSIDCDSSNDTAAIKIECTIMPYLGM